MERILETQEINLYNINAAANLKMLLSDKDQNILGTIRIPNTSKCDGAMYVVGDSMFPIIKSGDIICYKEIQDLNNIVYGDMYLVSMDIEGDEYLTIKYITRSEKGKGWVCLKSHNELHSPQDFELKYINALALIKVSIRMHTL
jgi:phage repressor protein C with HTH and peptisase S24 domain